MTCGSLPAPMADSTATKDAIEGLVKDLGGLHILVANAVTGLG